MQSAGQELNYGAGIVNHADTMDSFGIRDQMTDALQALASVTSDNRHAVANLSHTNVMLNDQVANLSKKATGKQQCQQWPRKMGGKRKRMQLA
eukprot:1078572-Ditylum_brightwellii.AAC.1